MQISEYLNQLNHRLAEGHTSEHTFRADLEALIRSLLPDFHVTNRIILEVDRVLYQKDKPHAE